MKRKHLFTVLATAAILLSCSKGNNPLDDTLQDNQTRSETSGGGGISATIVPRTKNDTIRIVQIIPPYEVKKDTIPNDSIPFDTVPKDSIPKDSTRFKNKQLKNYY